MLSFVPHAFECLFQATDLESGSSGAYRLAASGSELREERWNMVLKMHARKAHDVMFRDSLEEHRPAGGGQLAHGSRQGPK